MISLHLRNGVVVGQNLGGCGNVLVEKGRLSEPIGGAVAVGRTLTLYWSNGSCGGAALDRILARAEVHETADAVHVLLVSEPNPAVRKFSGAVFCAGVGRESHNTVTLKAPLGNRVLYDDSRLTPEEVTISKPVPSAPPSSSSEPGPSVIHPTGILDLGPQISATRWMNVNAWTGQLTRTTYLSVYAGGATIDPSLQIDATHAAVLVITPNDLDRFDHNQVALESIGTIYRPPGDPLGKLKVTAVNGRLLTLNLVGTSQLYTFDTTTDSFQ